MLSNCLFIRFVLSLLANEGAATMAYRIITMLKNALKTELGSGFCKYGKEETETKTIR